jgi:hypothetical protein
MTQVYNKAKADIQARTDKSIERARRKESNEKQRMMSRPTYLNAIQVYGSGSKTMNNVRFTF